ncbi:unnamed protein product [Lota lota]
MGRRNVPKSPTNTRQNKLCGVALMTWAGTGTRNLRALNRSTDCSHCNTHKGLNASLGLAYSSLPQERPDGQPLCPSHLSSRLAYRGSRTEEPGERPQKGRRGSWAPTDAQDPVLGPPDAAAETTKQHSKNNRVQGREIMSLLSGQTVLGPHRGAVQQNGPGPVFAAYLKEPYGSEE